jgi:hypothetical protein
VVLALASLHQSSSLQEKGALVDINGEAADRAVEAGGNAI